MVMYASTTLMFIPEVCGFLKHAIRADNSDFRRGESELSYQAFRAAEYTYTDASMSVRQSSGKNLRTCSTAGVSSRETFTGIDRNILLRSSCLMKALAY